MGCERNHEVFKLAEAKSKKAPRADLSTSRFTGLGPFLRCLHSIGDVALNKQTFLQFENKHPAKEYEGVAGLVQKND